MATKAVSSIPDFQKAHTTIDKNLSYLAFSIIGKNFDEASDLVKNFFASEIEIPCIYKNTIPYTATTGFRYEKRKSSKSPETDAAARYKVEASSDSQYKLGFMTGISHQGDKTPTVIRKYTVNLTKPAENVYNEEEVGRLISTHYGNSTLKTNEFYIKPKQPPAPKQIREETQEQVQSTQFVILGDNSPTYAPTNGKKYAREYVEYVRNLHNPKTDSPAYFIKNGLLLSQSNYSKLPQLSINGLQQNDTLNEQLNSRLQAYAQDLSQQQAIIPQINLNEDSQGQNFDIINFAQDLSQQQVITPQTNTNNNFQNANNSSQTDQNDSSQRRIKKMGVIKKYPKHGKYKSAGTKATKTPTERKNLIKRIAIGLGIVILLVAGAIITPILLHDYNNKDAIDYENVFVEDGGQPNSDKDTNKSHEDLYGDDNQSEDYSQDNDNIEESDENNSTETTKPNDNNIGEHPGRRAQTQGTTQKTTEVSMTNFASIMYNEPIITKSGIKIDTQSNTVSLINTVSNDYVQE